MGRPVWSTVFVLRQGGLGTVRMVTWGARPASTSGVISQNVAEGHACIHPGDGRTERFVSEGCCVRPARVRLHNKLGDTGGGSKCRHLCACVCSRAEGAGRYSDTRALCQVLVCANDGLRGLIVHFTWVFVVRRT